MEGDRRGPGDDRVNRGTVGLATTEMGFCAVRKCGLIRSEVPVCVRVWRYNEGRRRRRWDSGGGGKAHFSNLTVAEGGGRDGLFNQKLWSPFYGVLFQMHG